MTQNRTRRTLAASAAVSLGVALLAAPGLMSSASAHESDKVTVCHATGDAQHPYRSVEVSRSSILDSNRSSGDNQNNQNSGDNQNNQNSGDSQNNQNSGDNQNNQNSGDNQNNQNSGDNHVYDVHGGDHQQAWGDIVPAFDGYQGKNWSESGRSVHDHGCTVDGEHTTEPTTPPTTEPTDQPTSEPTDQPTSEPTDQPTDQPTSEPTEQPTSQPTDQPTTPTEQPSTPTEQPSTPTEQPSTPTEQPSTPSAAPTTPETIVPVVPVVPATPSTPAAHETTPAVTPVPTVDAPQVETMPSTGTVDHAAALPKTGAPVGSIAALGLGLIAAGGMALVAGRRRPTADGVSDDSEI